jgi:hypothetical protein
LYHKRDNFARPTITRDKEYNYRMRVRYETGVAALIQFACGTILAAINGGGSVIGECLHHSGADCATNTFVTLLFLIFTAGALAVLAILGYIAQERRSPRLAYILMAVEMGAALIYLFDAKQAPGLIDRITNLASCLIAVWVVVVAWRLARSRGARIVTRQRAHRRGVTR